MCFSLSPHTFPSTIRIFLHSITKLFCYCFCEKSLIFTISKAYKSNLYKKKKPQTKITKNKQKPILILRNLIKNHQDIMICIKHYVL